MIQKVGQALEIRGKEHVYNTNKTLVNNNSNVQNTIQSTQIDSKLLQKYYISFGASNPAKKSER